jgi:hypothetical protein
MEAADGGALQTKDVCKVDCNEGKLLRAEVKRRMTECPRDTLQIASCHLDSDALAPLRLQSHPDLIVTFQAVTGTVDLQGAELHQVVVVESKVDTVVLHDATVDRVRIAPSTSPVPDAYQEPATAPSDRAPLKAVDARGCHAKMFGLLESDVSGAVDLRHARIDDTLDLSWTRAGAINVRFADVLRIEAARLQTDQALDLFGARAPRRSASTGPASGT